MRTPGHDFELAMGFLLTEGVIAQASEVFRIEAGVDDDGLPLANVVNVLLQQPEDVEGAETERDSEHKEPVLLPHPVAFERHFAVSASCGLCGKNSIDDLMRSTPPLPPSTLRFSVATFYELAERLRSEQTVFMHTGGLHAAGIFSKQGELLLLREDVGRHNAVDKLIGHGLLGHTFPYHEHILLVSGRTSFEIIQKALLARIPCIAAISAPSSLAVELADQGGITLIGFLRDHSMNVYTHAERVVR
jgi:FdhD protein